MKIIPGAVRDPRLINLVANEYFDPDHSDARFLALLKEVGPRLPTADGAR